jgi:hypothetical protein
MLDMGVLEDDQPVIEDETVLEGVGVDGDGNDGD